MDSQEAWIKALKNTQIIRSRVKSLMTFSDTAVPYILLSESSVNLGDTVVRKGKVMVEKPALILPPNMPQFDGFESDDVQQSQEDSFMNFLLVRGIHLPSLHYDNKTHLLDVYEGDIGKAIGYYKDELQKRENVHSGLIIGPEDCWQFSVLIYICTQIAKNVDFDIRRLLDEFREKGK